MDCTHPATSLDLKVKSNLNMHYQLYNLKHYYSYQKSLFHQVVRETNLLIDLQNHTVKFDKINEKDWYKLNTSWSIVAPEYKVVVKVNRTTGQDDGVWFISTRDKSVLAHFNRSDGKK